MILIYLLENFQHLKTDFEGFTNYLSFSILNIL